jgi:hypothetical protein
VAGSCEYGDEPSGSGATELVKWCLHNVRTKVGLLCYDSNLGNGICGMLLPTQLIAISVYCHQTPKVVFSC